jgi:PAS domain S-box-containing protein
LNYVVFRKDNPCTTAKWTLITAWPLNWHPVGLVLSRHRTMVDCNQAVCEMFGAAASNWWASRFQMLYPSADEYERTGARIAPILNAKGSYADDRVMKRVDGASGETFWCHVSGRALNRKDPHEAGIWTFEDLSARARSRPS